MYVVLVFYLKKKKNYLKRLFKKTKIFIYIIIIKII